MDVKHIANLANLSLTPAEEVKFADQFTQTLKTIDLINELDTSQVAPTSQVTGLENVSRPDAIDAARVLTQDQALSNAPHTHQGFFQVPAIL